MGWSVIAFIAISQIFRVVTFLSFVIVLTDDFCFNVNSWLTIASMLSIKAFIRG